MLSILGHPETTFNLFRLRSFNRLPLTLCNQFDVVLNFFGQVLLLLLDLVSFRISNRVLPLEEGVYLPDHFSITLCLKQCFLLLHKVIIAVLVHSKLFLLTNQVFHHTISAEEVACKTADWIPRAT